MSGIGSMTDDQSPEKTGEKTAIMFGDHHLFPDAGESLEYPFGHPQEFGVLQEIATGVYRFRMPLPFTLDHINLYILEDGDDFVIVDTGLNTSKSREVWEGVLSSPQLSGRQVSKIIVTHYHPDHIGLAGWLVKKTGADLHMTRSEFLLAQTLLLGKSDHPPEDYIQFYAKAGIAGQPLEMMRQSSFDHYSKGVHKLPLGNIRLWQGEQLKIGCRTWQVVIGAGHSPEHACLYCEDDKILISGDQLLPKITSNVSVYPSEPRSNPLGHWIGSLQKLRTLEADTLVLPAHNDPFKGLYIRVDQILASHMRRLKSVWEIIEKPSNAVGLFPALFKRRLSGIDFIMGLGEALAHVHHLERKGLASRDVEEGVYQFKQQGEFDPMLVMGEKEHVG